MDLDICVTPCYHLISINRYLRAEFIPMKRDSKLGREWYFLSTDLQSAFIYVDIMCI